MFLMLDCTYLVQFVFLASLKPLYFILLSVTKMVDKYKHSVLTITQKLQIKQTTEWGNSTKNTALPFTTGKKSLSVTFRKNKFKLLYYTSKSVLISSLSKWRAIRPTVHEHFDKALSERINLPRAQGTLLLE